MKTFNSLEYPTMVKAEITIQYRSLCVCVWRDRGFKRGLTELKAAAGECKGVEAN